MSEQDELNTDAAVTEVEQPGERHDATEEDEDPEGAEQLGDAGKKALDAMKARLRDERRRRREVETELADLKKPKPTASPAKSEANGEADAPDPAELRRELEAEVKAQLEGVARRERVLDKIEAKAAKSFADPTDAVTLLRDKTDDFLDDDGKPDLEAIQDALKQLLENKPYLGVAAQGGTKRFQGTGDGGAKPPKPARPKSLDEAVKMRLSK